MKKTPFKILINAYDTTFSVQVAETLQEVDSCLELRTRYFSDGTPSLDMDKYDDYCCHLMVIDNQTGKAVGTYRLMRYDVADQHIGYYCESEFDLDNIKKHGLKLVEMGRLCTAEEYRNKNVISMLWNGIYEYLEHYKLDYLSGCVSTPADCPDDLTSKMYAYAKHKDSVVSPDFSVKPLPHCIDKTFDPNFVVENMAVLKKELPKAFLGYMVLNTKVCGPSAHDDVLNLKDFYILSDVKDREKHRRIQRFKNREQ